MSSDAAHSDNDKDFNDGNSENDIGLENSDELLTNYDNDS